MVPFYTYRLVAFVTRTHPWARRRSIPIHAFAGERIIVRETTSLTRQVLMRALNRAKVQPASLIEIDNREAGRDAVALGMGVGVMSETEFPNEDRHTVAVEIDAPDMQLTEYVACVRGRAQTRVIRTFFEIASDMAPKAHRVRRR
jgi:DNA-binding transcriptional LysR family regulator